MNSTTANIKKESRIGSWSLAMRRVLVSVFMAVIAVGVGAPRTVEAATQAQIDTAITNGLAYLNGLQSGSDGSFVGDGYTAANTGLAVAVLEHYAEKLNLKPLDAAFTHKTKVVNGLKYLINSAVYDSGNGWVYWSVGGNDSYQSGIPLMALARSGVADTFKVSDLWPTPGDCTSPLKDFTIKQVTQKAVDWLDSAQIKSGVGNGAWYYNKAGATVGDQSTNGWATMGLGYAKHSMGATITADLLTRLEAFNNYIQSQVAGADFGGAAYTTSYTGWYNVYKTGGLLFQQGLVGYDTSNQRVKDALKFMDYHWGDTTNGSGSSSDYGWRGNPGGSVPASYTAMFSASKGFTEHALDTFTVSAASGGSGVVRNWYNDFTDVIIATQAGNGSWTGGGHGEDALRSTACALLVLERAQSHIPPVVTSGAATNITTASATINGTLTSIGTSTSVAVTFQYGISPGVYTLETTPQIFNSSPSNFTVTLSGLSLGTTFYYRSKATGTAGSVSTGTGYSGEVSFVTPNTLTYFPAITNGSATPATYANISYPSNTGTYTFDFTTNAGYHLTGVSSPCGGTATVSDFAYVNDTAGVTAVSYTVAKPATTSCIVTATTAANLYSITSSATDNNGAAGVGGSISCPASIAGGGDPSCTFTPATGYHVYDVIVDGSSVWNNYSAIGVNTTTASRALGATTSPRIVLVKFRKDTYLITTTPGANGTITPANSYFDYGTTPALTVAGNSGYYVVTIGGTCGAAYSNTGPDYNVMSKPYTTNTISAPCTITSSYALGYRYISTSVTPAGNAVVSCPASVIHGQTGSCTVTPNTGYHITAISGCFGSAYTAAAYNNGTAGEITNTFSLGTVTNDCTVSATVAINKFNITVTPDAHSKFTGYGLNTPHIFTDINYNASQAMTFDADTANGYHLTAITNGCGGTASATYRNDVNEPWTKTAIFTPSGTAGQVSAGVVANCSLTTTSTINVYSITPTIGSVGP